MPSLSAVEILVILAVALVVLGPQKLPSAARQVGQVFNELRRMAVGFQAEMKDALNEVESGTPGATPLAPPRQANGAAPPLSPPGTPPRPSAPQSGRGPLTPPDTGSG